MRAFAGSEYRFKIAAGLGRLYFFDYTKIFFVVATPESMIVWELWNKCKPRLYLRQENRYFPE